MRDTRTIIESRRFTVSPLCSLHPTINCLLILFIIVIAIPAHASFLLTITKDGSGSGMVSSFPAGISCGTTCLQSYDAGTQITLSATPDPGTFFAGWSGSCSGTSSCQLAMNELKSVTATFSRYYNISEIPPVTAWQGNPSILYILSSKLGISASLSYSINGVPPKGAISFESTTGKFSYTPDPTDKQPFSVTFAATLGANTPDTQTVQITPLPKLEPENSVFGLQKQIINTPDSEATDYVVKKETWNASKPFNAGGNRATRNIEIVGYRVVFEDGHANGLYGYHKNPNIENMVIYADTVVFKSPLLLPQTNVTIYARELRFQDLPSKPQAYLSTTPESEPNAAANASAIFNEDGSVNQVSPAGNGKNGFKAGDIRLHIQNYFADSTLATRFILNGGNGQKAGEGIDGLPGFSMPTVGDCGGWQNNPIGNNLIYIVVFNYPFGPYTSIKIRSECGNGDYNLWPKDGNPPITPGKPGEAGAGGNLYISNSGFQLNTTQSGGNAGEKALDRHGGIAGTPQHAIRAGADIVNNQGAPYNYFSYEERFTSDAKGVQAQAASAPVGPSGSLISNGTPNDWLSPAILKMVLIYAKDVYLAGDMNTTKAILTNYDGLLESYSASPDWASLSETDQLELKQMQGEVQVVLHRIASNLDYFGNPAGWVPMLSFEVTKAAYENEIDPAIRLWYLSYWLGNMVNNATAKQSAMTTGRTKLLEEIDSFRKSYNEANTLIPALITDIGVITNETSLVNQKLMELDHQLQARAAANVAERYKVPEWKKACATIGTICQVLPVYQPALGMVGAGLVAVSKVDTNQPVETTIANLSAEYKNIGSNEFKSSFEQYSANWNSLTTSLKNVPEGSGFNADNAKQYASGVTAAFGPVADHIKKYNNIVKDTQAPMGEVEQELAKLRASDPAFTELTNQVQQLLIKKEAFVRKMQATQQAVTTFSNGINHNLLAVDELNRGIMSMSDALDIRAMAYLKEMEKSSKERLLKYHYYMSKAYEYRMLTPYAGTLNLDPIFNKLINIAQLKISDPNTNNSDGTTTVLSHELTSSQFTAVKTIYEQQVSAIAANIYSNYISNFPDSTTTIRYSLTPADIQILNSGKPLALNLVERDRFLLSENIRIADLKVADIKVHPVGGNYDTSGWAEINVVMAHSGLSKLTKNGGIYQFKHYSNSTVNPITWRSKLNALIPLDVFNTVPENRNPIQEVPSAASESLILSLLSSPSRTLTSESLLLFSRPAVWADIMIGKEVNTNNGVDIAIDSLSLDLRVDS